MKEAIRGYISDALLSGVSISDEDDLLLSGLLDSMSVIRLVLHLETEFSIKIPPEDVIIEHFTSVEAITTYLESKVAA